MTLIQVLMQVDGDEQSPIGAYPTVAAARAAALEQDLQFADSDDERAETTTNFDESWNANVKTPAEFVDEVVIGGGGKADVQWESGNISLDYRIVSVEMK